MGSFPTYIWDFVPRMVEEVDIKYTRQEISNCAWVALISSHPATSTNSNPTCESPLVGIIGSRRSLLKTAMTFTFRRQYPDSVRIYSRPRVVTNGFALVANGISPRTAGPATTPVRFYSAVPGSMAHLGNF
ncbi:hypothetical protein CMK12_03395 [Candidatus Poribacteria bacterium]|nr:hypothetical protein [Candidatus Poribacteria bacterium]